MNTRRAPAPSPYVYRTADGYRLTRAGHDYLRAAWPNPNIAVDKICSTMNITTNSARMLAVRAGLGRKAICRQSRAKPEQEALTGWFEDHERTPPPGSMANAIKAAQRYAP